MIARSRSGRRYRYDGEVLLRGGPVPRDRKFVAPYLTLQNNKRTPGLVINQEGSGNADRRYTMTVNAPGEYYFTVRNSSGNLSQTNRGLPKVLRAAGFNDINLN